MMEKKKIDFNEALRRIATTPKAVVEQRLASSKDDNYNAEKATEKPPRPAKRSS